MGKNIQDWEEFREDDNPQVLDRLTRFDQKCSYCKPNRGENATKQPRQDRHKNKNRSSIRKQVIDNE